MIRTLSCMGLTKKIRVAVFAATLLLTGALGIAMAPSADAAPDPGNGICVGGIKITYGSATLLNLSNTWVCEPWV